MEHVSVLKKEVYEYLDLKEGDVVVDATLGLGGHAKGMLELIGSKGRLIGFDQDERNLAEAKKRLIEAGYEKNIELIHDNFRSLKTRLEEVSDSGVRDDDKEGIKVDAILFDLGVSSPHLDLAERGFSFQKEGPLDMRFSETQRITAADVINDYPEAQLADVIFLYGEERASRKIARRIVERRQDKKFETTKELADFIEGVIPVRYPKKKAGGGRASRSSKKHPATKTFQALRIEVNDELNALKEALQDSIDVLQIGGRVVVISYHSLEDRIVKHFFKELNRTCICPREQLVCDCRGESVVELVTRKPVAPSKEEVSENPRARSAKLRAVKKLREI